VQVLEVGLVAPGHIALIWVRTFFRHLDLDDGRTPVSELANAGRSGANASQVKDG
jgi:hypothetical protein